MSTAQRVADHVAIGRKHPPERSCGSGWPPCGVERGFRAGQVQANQTSASLRPAPSTPTGSAPFQQPPPHPPAAARWRRGRGFRRARAARWRRRQLAALVRCDSRMRFMACCVADASPRRQCFAAFLPSIRDCLSARLASHHSRHRKGRCLRGEGTLASLRAAQRRGAFGILDTGRTGRQDDIEEEQFGELLLSDGVPRFVRQFGSRSAEGDRLLAARSEAERLDADCPTQA